MTEDDIKHVAISRCLGAGYKEGTNDYTACVFEETRAGMDANKKGKVRDWVDKQGGFWQALDTLGSIANKVKGYKTASGTPSDYDIGLENTKNSPKPLTPSEEKRKNIIMWVTISIIMVILIVVFIIVMRKKNTGKK
jgi:hypothetical protein